MRRFAVTALAALALLGSVPALASGADGPSSQRAQQVLQRVEDLRQGIGVRTGRELTPALLELYRTRGALDAAGRRQANALLARPTSTESAPGHAYTVAEATPFCTTHFCIHYVTTTVDAPDQTDADNNGVPDYVELMAHVFENEVFPCENGSAALGCAAAGTTGLGWPQAPDDGTLGGDSRFDVYIEDLFPSGVFGYVAVDSQPAGSSLHSYLVMDKDFSRYSQTLTGPDEMRVTAAHEYNHVLQFGIDANEDDWMFESTATFFENEVYPAIDDYLSYMPTWVGATADPLTDAAGGGGLKIYGSAVWNHFIAGRHGAGTILAAWQAKTQVVSGHTFAPASYDTAISAGGGQGFSSEFDDFAAAVAEWDTPSSGFPDVYPDVPASARPTMNVGAAATSISLDHTTFAFRDIPVPASPTTLTLTATLPSGLNGAVALVARTGNSTTAGTVTTSIQRVTSGGAAAVSLPNADTYGRITAVLVNADPSQNGFNNGHGDWNFTKDAESYTGVQVTTGAAVPAPLPTTTAATAVGQTSATLNGTVNPNGQATTYYFEYGTTTAYGTQSPPIAASAGSGSSALAFSTAITGLTRGTTYHYRIVAQSAGGTIQGSDQSFRTLDPPLATTTTASSLTTDGATMNASVDPRGQATTYLFQYGPTVGYGSQLPLSPAAAGSGGGPVAVSATLSGLAPGTTIHYRVLATNPDGTTIGGDQSFRTLDPPSVTTGAAGGVTATGAVVTGTVDAQGKATTFVFEYGTTTGYGSQVSGDAGTATSPASVAAQLTGLAAGTPYHYRLVATNADGTTSGADATFTTTAASGATASGTPSTTTTTGTTGSTPGATGTTTTETTATTGTTAGSATALTITVTVVRVKLKAALAKGLKARVGCAGSCTLRLALVLSRTVAKKLQLPITVASGKATARSGAATVALLRFTRKARAQLSPQRVVTLTLVVTARTADGQTATLKRAITVRR